MADFSHTLNAVAPYTAAVTKAGDPETPVEVEQQHWAADGVVCTLELPSDGTATCQVRGAALGTGSLTYTAVRVSDELAITKVVSVEVVEATEPAPDVTVTKGAEV